MEVGNVSETQTTNANGQAISDTPINDTDAAKKTVLCIAENWTKTENGVTIRYLGTQKGFFDGFTVPPEPTSTQPPTQPPTTGTTDSPTTAPPPVITTGTKDPTASAGSTDSTTGVTYPTILGARDYGECRQPDRGQPFPRFRDSEPVWPFADGFRDKKAGC